MYCLESIWWILIEKTKLVLHLLIYEGFDSFQLAIMTLHIWSFLFLPFSLICMIPIIDLPWGPVQELFCPLALFYYWKSCKWHKLVASHANITSVIMAGSKKIPMLWRIHTDIKSTNIPAKRWLFKILFCLISYGLTNLVYILFKRFRIFLFLTNLI